MLLTGVSYNGQHWGHVTECHGCCSAATVPDMLQWSLSTLTQSLKSEKADTKGGGSREIPIGSPEIQISLFTGIRKEQPVDAFQVNRSIRSEPSFVFIDPWYPIRNRKNWKEGGRGKLSRRSRSGEIRSSSCYYWGY